MGGSTFSEKVAMMKRTRNCQSLMTRAQIAKKANVSVYAVRLWIEDGLLGEVIIGEEGGASCVMRDEVCEFLRERRERKRGKG